MNKERDPAKYYSRGEKGFSYGEAEYSESYNNRILNNSGVRQGSTVLDVSSGLGNEARYFKEHFKAKVYELDISPDAFLANPDLKRNFLIGDYNKMPYRDAVFDLVHIKDATEHLFDKELFFSEVYRVLKPKGKLLMVSRCLDENDYYYPYLAFREDEGAWVKYGIKDMKDYYEAVKYLKHVLHKDTKISVSPPLFFLPASRLNFLAEKAGFHCLNNPNMPGVWFPDKNEKNWGSFLRKVLFFEK